MLLSAAKELANQGRKIAQLIPSTDVFDKQTTRKKCFQMQFAVNVAVKWVTQRQYKIRCLDGTVLGIDTFRPLLAESIGRM